MKDAADLARWAARDFVHNLEHLPADKLDWKPTPEAKSALQIAGEVAGVIGNTLPVLKGESWATDPLPQPGNLAEAEQLVLERAQAYADALESVDRASLKYMMDLPFGKFWAERFVLFPLIETIHHRGQICYLQSLLGDAEVRFDPVASEEVFSRPI